MTLLAHRPFPLVGQGPLTIGEGRVAQFAETGWGVRDIAQLDRRLIELPVDHGSPLGALGDGSLVSVNGTAAFRLPPGSSQPLRVQGYFPLLRGVRFCADLDRALGFYLATATMLVHFEMPEGEGKVTNRGHVLIPDGAAATLVVLGGGFAYQKNDAHIRRASFADPRGIDLPLADVVHLAPAGPGRAWASFKDHRVALLDLAPGEPHARIVAEAKAGAQIITLDGSATHAAAFTIDYEPGKRPVGALIVWDERGTEVFRAPFPWPLVLNEMSDWFVALSPFEPVVALGGRSRVAVWSIPDGRLLGS